MENAAPLGERALKYGRNTIVMASIIIVLARVPGIELCKFHPFGFEFTPGNEKWVWGLLGMVLFYYALHFAIQAWIDIPNWQPATDGPRARPIPWRLAFKFLKWWDEVWLWSDRIEFTNESDKKRLKFRG